MRIFPVVLIIIPTLIFPCFMNYTAAAALTKAGELEKKIKAIFYSD
jgi:hypothetical protein